MHGEQLVGEGLDHFEVESVSLLAGERFPESLSSARA